jgi:dihydroorotate dehydrogenase
MLYQLAKAVLFRMDPEKAHHLTIRALSRMPAVPGGIAAMKRLYGVPEREELVQRLWGIRFPNPVGLAAGLDKNGEAVPAFSAAGFGFVEVGTVTPKGQPGNDRPRLFRLPEDRALINRMGFNNEGAEAMAARLGGSAAQRVVPLGINIGKNKTTPNEMAEDDYRACVRHLYACGDFFVVNISSPNTPDLRNLQHGEELRRLLAAVLEEVSGQSRRLQEERAKPVLVKIAPDLTEDELTRIVDIVAASGASGIIATNTTVARDGLAGRHRGETGGLSGRPLADVSTRIIRHIYRQTGGTLPIVGCGGIFSAEDAYAKIRAGASLVELYTALIYKGPGILRDINEGLAALLKRDGFGHLSEAVGADER